MIVSFCNHPVTLWLKSAGVFVLVLFIGFLFKKYVAKFIQNILLKTGHSLFDEMITMSRKYVSFWFFLIASYIAFLQAPIRTIAGINKLFYMVFAFSVVIFIASIISKLVQKSITKEIGTNTIRFGIIFIGLILILNQAGIKFPPILTALGFVSAAIALALKDTFAIFFAGINIIASKRIAKDDYIKLDSGQEGTVIEVNWRTTLLKEISNTVIIVPNDKLSSAIVTSFHFNKEGVTATVTCGVAYGSDLERVEKIALLATQEIIDKNNDAVKTFTPIVRFISFTNSSIEFTVFFRVKSVYKRLLIQSEVLKNLNKKLKEEKIEIPFPQRIVTLKKE
ncbi:MAG: mechanosensitive ion channel family protein [Endomicrobium sp.]|jgi:small-conductance mechanosensitive channel|nr:mechanosensitive ion channel family protein [Endomicrobium sp.]